MHASSSLVRRGATGALRCRGLTQLNFTEVAQPRFYLTISHKRSRLNLRQYSASTTTAKLENVSESADKAQAQAPVTAAEQHVANTPPAPEGELGIVFTDIVKSTDIWEEDPNAMALAMQTHDNIIRTMTQAHQGYEVKQNGDGFMIAFATATSALQFCLAVQQKLLYQTWPDELLTLQPGEVTKDSRGNVLFRGLRLRMSAHWGKPVCNWNHVIKRMDYLGPVVNRAARFVQVTEGGQIVVSEEFLLEVQKAKLDAKTDATGSDAKAASVIDLEELNRVKGQESVIGDKFEVSLLGKHQLKGLPEPQKLYFIVPRALHGRLDYWPKHRYIPGSKGNVVSDE